MDLVIRGLAVYLFLLLIFRVSGKRSLRNATTFDFVLLLIIAETTQQALVGEDASLSGAFLLIVVLVGTDIRGARAQRRHLDRAATRLRVIGDSALRISRTGGSRAAAECRRGAGPRGPTPAPEHVRPAASPVASRAHGYSRSTVRRGTQRSA